MDNLIGMRIKRDIFFKARVNEPKLPAGLSFLKRFKLNSMYIVILAITFLSSLIVFAQQEKKEARILIVTGNDYPGHEWKKTTPALTNLLSQDKRLKIEVLYDPNKLGEVDLKRFDAVILHFMNWETTSPPIEARANLQNSVKEGKGLMLIHFACGAWQDWKEFRQIAGRVWNPKFRPHDPRGVFLVEITDREHPITRGLKDFQTDDELYTCLDGERPVHIIAKAKSKVDGKDYPMAFVFEYGRGRVFHTVLGHDVKAITNSAVPELFRRGCAWVAGLDPDLN
ncbi:MAG: ThuA domain-containing protein [Limisphaerales bacterium]|jgi:type 1 glutamine amidotransferase